MQNDTCQLQCVHGTALLVCHCPRVEDHCNTLALTLTLKGSASHCCVQWQPRLKPTILVLLVEFMGFEQQLQPVWLARDSERIWRGSYKNKAWKHLVRLPSLGLANMLCSTSFLHSTLSRITRCVCVMIQQVSGVIWLAFHLQWIIQCFAFLYLQPVESCICEYSHVHDWHRSGSRADMCMVGCCMGSCWAFGGKLALHAMPLQLPATHTG